MGEVENVLELGLDVVGIQHSDLAGARDAFAAQQAQRFARGEPLLNVIQGDY